MLEDLLKKGHCFKLICGAGKEDTEEIRRLVYIYALAGCKFFDLSANLDVIDAAKESLQRSGMNDIYICVSVGIKGDPHLNKAVIDYNKCVNCGSCESVCPENAIHYVKIKKSKCTGCTKCFNVCPRGAISYISEEKNFIEVIPEIIKKGIDCIEFHSLNQDENDAFEKWKYLNDNFDGILSLCIGRKKFCDEELIERISKMLEIRRPYTTIIQADGISMSGGEDNLTSTLQAVATAQIVSNANFPVYLVLSGGTNTKTSELAKMCAVSNNGVAMGSFARKIVRKYIEREDFWHNKNIIAEAVENAAKLVKSA